MHTYARKHTGGVYPYSGTSQPCQVRSAVAATDSALVGAADSVLVGVPGRAQTQNVALAAAVYAGEC